MITNKKTRKEKKEFQLLKYWDKKRRMFTSKQLISLAGEIEHLPLKRRAIETFLEAEGLAFDDYYKMLYVAQDLFEQDKVLSEKFYEKFFDKRVTGADHLMELTLEGNTKAAKELIRRIDAQEVNRDKSKQILTTLFEKITDTTSRKAVYKKVEKLKLEEKELNKIAEIAKKAFLYGIADKIRRKIKRLKKGRSKQEKALLKIRRFLWDIEQEQKKQV